MLKARGLAKKPSPRFERRYKKKKRRRSIALMLKHAKPFELSNVLTLAKNLMLKTMSPCRDFDRAYGYDVKMPSLGIFDRAYAYDTRQALPRRHSAYAYHSAYVDIVLMFRKKVKKSPKKPLTK